MGKKVLQQIIFLLSFLFILNDLEVHNNTLSDDESILDLDNETELMSRLNSSEVLRLDSKNYVEEIKKYEFLYLLMYAPWSDKCKRFFPEFLEASDYFISQNINVKFAVLDGDRFIKIRYEFGVEGMENFPSLFLFINGTRNEFKGEKTKQSVIKFAKKMKYGPITFAKTLEEIDEINKDNKNNKILISTIKDKNLLIYKSFKELAKIKINEDYEYISCLSTECIKKYGQDDIILLKNFDEKINYYSKDYEPISKAQNDSLNTFIGIFGMKNGGGIGQKEFDMIINDRKSLFYFREQNNEKQTSYDKVFQKLGKELRFKKTYTFVSDIKGNDFLDEVRRYFSLSPEQLPVVMFLELKNGDEENPITYRFSKATANQLTAEYLLKYIEDIKNGKIKRDLKSSFEDSPTQIEGLKRIYGISYDKDVIEEKKNVCILLLDEYSEIEIGKKYLEVFKKLGENYSKEDKKEKNIVFAIMNLAVNEPRDIDLSTLDVNHFAYIYLYTNALKEKKVIKFTPKAQDSISEEEVQKFLDENLGLKEENKSDL